MLHDTDLVSIQEVRAKVEKAYAAFQEYRRYSQEQIDAILDKISAGGYQSLTEEEKRILFEASKKLN